MSKAHLVKHFQVENIPCATIYWIMKCFEDGLPCENKRRKGCPNKLNKQQQQKLKILRKILLVIHEPKYCQQQLKKL